MALLVYSNANTMLFPYFEQGNLNRLYDQRMPSFLAPPAVAKTVIPLFLCPSNSKPNLLDLPQFAPLDLPVGATYAVTDYVYCKGPNDAWCLPPSKMPVQERGVFFWNSSTRIADIRDGSSNTAAMGEGAGGAQWPVCRGAGCTTPYPGPSGPTPATGLWFIGTPGNPLLESLGYITGSIWGSTVERPNKSPVTDSYADGPGNFDNCDCSVNGGPHSTANFRGDHPGGLQFLFSDGSVHFVQEAIDMQAYRRLSTIAEGVP